MNFSSHAAAWALRTTLTKFPFCWTKHGIHLKIIQQLFAEGEVNIVE